jgi:flavin-dependent dehydrogenase
MPQLAHDRAVLIGDAASMINSLSDEGIFYGMEAGRLVASVAGAEVLGSAARLNAALVRFESTFRNRFSAHFRSCFLAQRAIKSPRVNVGIIRAARRDPRVFENLVGLMFGEGRLGVGMVARIAAQAF